MLAIVALLPAYSLLLAQNEKEFFEKIEKDFQLFKQDQANAFKAFREQTNREFSAFLRCDWEAFSAERPQQRLSRPKPPQPYEAGPTKEKPQELKADRMPPAAAEPKKDPTKLSDIRPVIPQKETEGKITLSFYGQKYGISPLFDRRPTLGNLTEERIAELWDEYSALPYGNVLNECAGIRKDLRLNDWGYFKLCGEAARCLSNGEEGNETVFLHAFLLCQSGYDARIARTEKELLLLLPSPTMIYGHSFLTIDGEKYFILNKTEAPATIYTYRKNLSLASNTLDMHLIFAPRMAGSVEQSNKQLKHTGERFEVPVNRSLMEFYREYPQCEYSIYMKAPVDTLTSNALLPVLQRLIEGKPETEAARLLLDFVQTSFDYRTDQQQFGDEKPFFVEEMFLYPFCDCEDRSLFFAYLIKSLLDLEVVLLDYPDHIATAVRFSEAVEGDFIRVEGEKYVVCDPTYIHASIGEAMPRYKNISARILTY